MPDNTSDGIRVQLQALAQREDVTTKSRRTILQPQHLVDFVGDTLFDEFARVVCRSKCVPRKELFETWVMAVCVQDSFPHCQRIADLASGHGLLSWALMALDSGYGTRSAVCIDVQMPRAADVLQQTMHEHWPRFQGNWDYVQAKLECLEPDPSTLLLGVHCCGVLSDRIVDLTIQGNCPLALVPCCHSKQSLNNQQLKDFGEGFLSLTDYIDSQRIQRLKEAGFDVSEQEIPEVFTPKNRIILATPPAERLVDSPTSIRIPKWKKNHATIHIPVADHPEARATVRALAGRLAAKERDKPPPTTLVVPLSFGTNPTNTTIPAITAQEIQAEVVDPLFGRFHGDGVVDQSKSDDATTSCIPTVQAGQPAPVLMERSGESIQNFCIVYDSEYWSNRNPASFHVEVCQQIPKAFEGISVRPLPKKILRKAMEKAK